MATTLAFLRLEPDKVWRFEFGDSLEPAGNTAQFLARILEEFDHRKEEIGNLGNEARMLLLDEVRGADEESPSLPFALLALGLFGKPEGWEDVVARTKSNRREVSLAAIHALGQMGKPASADALVPFLTHPSVDFRRAALISIGKLARADLLPLLATDLEMQRLLTEAKERTDATLRRDVEAVFEAVIDTEEYRDLIPLALVVARRILYGFIEHDPPPKRQAHLADLCGLMGLCGATQKWKDLLRDEGTPLEVRIACISGLGRCRENLALDVILLELQRSEASLRAASITALGNLGLAQAFSPLLRLWDDDNGKNRPRLRLALRRISSPMDWAAMSAALTSDQVPAIRDFAVIDSRLALHLRNPALVISPLLESSLAAERGAACFVLAFTGSGEYLSRLQMLSTRDPEETVRAIAGRAAAVLAARGEGKL